MNARPRATLARLVAVAVALAGVAIPSLPQPAAATAGFTFTRFAGQDREDTARLIATGTFTSSAGADTVLLARDNDFADALAGAFLAGQPASAVLLTMTDTLPPITAAALSSLKTKNVVLLGGTAAISTAVEDQLKAMSSTSAAGGTLNVTRIGGGNRYDTARLVSSKTGTSVGSVDGQRTAIVASGLNFPDALAGGPMGVASKFPVLLTNPAVLSTETGSALTALNIKHVLLLGGPLAVSAGVASQIQAANGGIAVERLFGGDRTETATAIANYELTKLGFGNTHVNLANGANFPDALAGGPHSGLETSPILLTSSPTLLGTATSSWLSGHKTTLTAGHIFGGPAAVDPTVADLAAAAAGSTGSFQQVTVTPATTANPHFSASTSSNEGARTCTATVPGGISAVDIALFPTNSLSTDLSGNKVFTDANGDGLADITVDATGGVIESSNGVLNPQTPDTNYLDGVPVGGGGTVSFVIDSTTQDDVVAVVFADTTSDNKLNLTGAGTTPKPPAEIFGAGCRTRWIPDDYHPGPIVGDATVTYVDKTAKLFVATPSDAATGATFHWVDSDQLTVGNNPSPDAAGFVKSISPGDTVKGSNRLSGSAPSQYNLTDSAPLAPTSPTASEHATSVVLGWTPSTTPGTDSTAIYRCVIASCTYAKIATVPAWMTTYTDTGLTADTGYIYLFRAVDEGDESPDSPTVSVTARATDAPVINQARVSTDAAPAGTAGAGDVHTLVFSEPMNASIAANNSTYRVRDGDATATVVDIVCGSGGTTCALSGDGRTLTVTVGTPTVVTAGTTAGLQYPGTITNVSTGWVDKGTDSDGGTPLDLAGSPDKVIEADTTAPTMTDARATTDGGLIGVSGPGDVHQFIFSEPMAAPTNATQYTVNGANAAPDTVSCSSAPTPHNTCTLNSAPVTIGGVTYSAGRVLTVSVDAGLGPATYPLTMTGFAGMTDAAGNPLNFAGSPDKTIQVAANP